MQDNVTWKQPVLWRREDGEALLQPEQNPQDARADKATDYLATVPSEQGPAKIDGHDSRYGSTTNEHGADPVNGADPVEQFHLTAVGVRRWKQEDVGWGCDSADDEIDVKSPAPGRRAICKGTTDDRSKYGARSPDNTHATDVNRTLLVGGGHR